MIPVEKYDDRRRDLCICGHSREQHVLNEDAAYSGGCKRCHCPVFIDVRDRD